MKLLTTFILTLSFLTSFAQNPGDIMRSKKIANNTIGMSNSISSGDNFGVDVTAIGDVNGDGVNDLAVGAAHYGTSGGVFILFMDTNGTVQSKTILSENSNGIGDMSYNGLFGYAVCSMGDINNDGIPDIGVSEMNSSDGGVSTGAIHIITLSSAGAALSQTKISKTTGYGTGGIPISVGKTFGTGMDTIGDLNNDGYNDLIVGGYQDSQAGTNKGAAYVILLNEKNMVKSYYKIYEGVPNFNASIDNDDYFGVSCCAAGDYDNDGVLDIIVGAHRDSDEIYHSGAFYIIHLNNTGTVKSYTKVSNSSFPSANPFTSNSSRSISTICDLDGNGTREIVSGVYRHDSDNGGAVIIFLDSNENIINYNLIDDNNIPSINSGSRFGTSVCFYQNYNNDDYPEMVVGAYFEDSDRGSIQILSLKSNSTYTNIETITNNKTTDFSIYPNPATNNVTIDWNSNISISELNIYDISGRLVLSKKIDTNTKNISTNISELSKGNYIIILKDNSDIKYGLQFIKN